MRKKDMHTPTKGLRVPNGWGMTSFGSQIQAFIHDSREGGDA